MKVSVWKLYRCIVEIEIKAKFEMGVVRPTNTEYLCSDKVLQFQPCFDSAFILFLFVFDLLAMNQT